MNSKERILATLERKSIDRLPVDIWHTPEVVESLQKHFCVNDEFSLWKAMGVDKIAWVFMEYSADDGVDAGSQVGGGAGGVRTMWGVPLKAVEAGNAHYDEYSEAPMKGMSDPEEVKDYPWWPDPDRFKYDAAVELAQKYSRDFAVIGPWISFFELYCQLRGIQQALMDVALMPKFVDAVLDRLEEIQTEMMTRFLEKAGDAVDLVFISDDMGMQENLLISPAMWKRFLEPRMKRWCALIHSFGKKVFYHSDGACEPLLQPLIDCGIDVLNPIQHVCPGMDPKSLKEKYGDRIIFHGGVDNQNVLPFGSVDDVIKQVNMLANTLGSGKEGYICASCHNIQAGTPIENIFAMVDAIKNM